MATHGCLFLLVSFFTLCLLGLWSLRWPHYGPAQSRAAAKLRPKLHRLLKPRCPDDCPTCRLASSASSGGGPLPAPVRPWREVKSRRGAPKRVNTEDFACPNHLCPYFGITDEQIHALVGDGKHGHIERIQTFRCQACHSTFSARRNTPLYRLKTPSHLVAVVLSALAEGLDPSAAERVFGFRQATITRWLTRAGEHAQTLHTHSFCNLQLPYVQLDHCCAPGCATPSRSCGSGSSSTPAPRFFRCCIWALARKTRRICSFTPCDRCWPPFCLPVFTSDGLNMYFYASRSAFWTVAPGSERVDRTPVAGGDEADLRPGEKMLPAAQAGASHARDASGNISRSLGRPTGDGSFGTTEHRLH